MRRQKVGWGKRRASPREAITQLLDVDGDLGYLEYDKAASRQLLVQVRGHVPHPAEGRWRRPKRVGGVPPPALGQVGLPPGRKPLHTGPSGGI